MHRNRLSQTGHGPAPLDQDYRKALNDALRWLAGRDHSKYELGRKLSRRGAPPAVVDRVLRKCEDLGYLDDNRTAELLIGLLARKGYGFKRIRHELQLKGLGGRSQILDACFAKYDEHEIAARIFRKHAARFDREGDLKKRKEKIYRFLYGRGFSREVVLKTIRDLY
jgi:regulatory protein